MRALKVLPYLLVVLGFSACDADSLQLINGQYQGSLVRRLSPGLQQKLVYANVQLANGLTNIDVREVQAGGNPIVSRVSLEVGATSVNLRVDRLMKEGVQLSAIDGEKNCFEGKSQYSLHVCVTEEELLTEVSDRSGNSVYSLSLTKFNSGKPPKFEAAQDFTPNIAAQKSLTLNFQSRIEYEHVMQARLGMKNAQLNMLPHISGATITAVGSAFVSGGVSLPSLAIQAVGDFFPFLLPSRWLNVDSLKLQSKSERQALAIMRLDAGAQSESMVYNLLRDQEITVQMASVIATEKSLRDEISERERFGQLPKGTTDDIDSAIDLSSTDLQNLQLLVSEEKHFLAQSMGLYNPEAVRDVSVGTETLPVQNAVPVNEHEAIATALDRSFELKQMDYLIASSRKSTEARSWEWLDPTGAPNAGLGFGTSSYVKIGESQTRELQIKRQLLQSQIMQKTADAVKEYNSGITLYQRASDLQRVQERRFNRIVDQVHFGTNYDMFGLLQVFKDYTQASVSAYTAVAEFRTARMKLDRVLLRGNYANPFFANQDLRRQQ
ncbi:MAG: hypothetical protein ACXWQO_11475 [Bdellovibrionota bacterium]